jgi:uncharacterized protein
MTDHGRRELAVTFTSNGLALSGTLTTPEAKTPAPAVLMLPGSGQTDRDDSAKQLPINLFPQLVTPLVAQGFATFSYDKRGVGASEGDYYSTGFNDNTADAAAAVAWLAQRPEVDASRIFVLGHSEGALHAVRLAAGVGAGTGAAAAVAGAILLAGAAKTGEETLLWQGRQIASTLTGFNKAVIRLLRVDVEKSQQKTFDRLKATTTDVTRIQLQKVNAKWMREFLAYDPATDLAKVESPVLAVTGSHDIQVDPSDLKRMTELIPQNFESHLVPGVTHLMRDDPENAGLKGYKAQAKQPVDARVVSLVAEWLKARVPA